MTSTCPAGHTSTADDYCDVCGMPIGEASVAGPGSAPPPSDVPTQAPALQVCPNCSAANPAEALFCEDCGYDFTTGTMPRSATAEATSAPAAPLTPPSGVAPLAPPDGVALPSPEGGPAASPPDSGDARPTATSGPPAPVEAPLRWVAEVWIDPAWFEVQESPDTLPSPGLPVIVPLRKSSVLIGRKSRSRGIDPDIDCEPDTGTSRRQAQLTIDGTRWWVEDLESSNGTFVGAASDPLPEDPIPVGVKRELAPDDRVYIGAWTRLVIREATEDEQATLA